MPVPNLTLKTMDFKPVVFNPVQYTIEPNDGTAMARSLQTVIAQEKESNANLIDSLNKATAYRNALDPSEYEWFKEEFDKNLDIAYEQFELGRTGTAFNLAMKGARDLAHSTDLQNKVAVNAARTKERERINQSFPNDPYMMRYWDYRNQYSYNGTPNWTPDWIPNSSINLQNLQSLAFQMTSEDAQSIANEKQGSNITFIDSNGEPTDDISEAVGLYSKSSGGKSDSESYHKKSKEDIEKTFRNLLKNKQISASLHQEFNILDYNYNYLKDRSEDLNLSEQDREQAKKELDELSDALKNENGQIIRDYDIWLEKNVISMFENMEYYNTAESHQRSNDINYGDTLFYNNRQKQLNNDAIIPEAEDVTVQGTPGSFTYILSNWEKTASYYEKYFTNKTQIPYRTDYIEQ